MKLLKPITINKTEIKNRIVMPGMETNFCEPGGIISDKIIEYYKHRAKGGTGLIVVESAYFDVVGRGTENMINIEKNRRVPGLKRLVEVIHNNGAKALLQIYHAGIQSTSFLTGEQIVGPSDVPSKLTGVKPKPLSKRDIKKLIKNYGKGCLRAKKAGFDGVEIHSGHGYLLNQFFSPLYNKRQDEYGGSLENRARLAIEVLQEVRKKCGPDFIICFRINCRDYIDGGMEVEEMKKIAKMLEDNGVDLISITAGIFDSPYYPVVPFMSVPRGVYSPYAKEIKQELDKTPVCVVGRINTPEIAEEILQENRADMVAMGRAVIIDPYFPKKLMNNNREDIQICPACNACLNQILIEESLKCALNPDVCKTDEDIPKTEQPIKVLIIGAGPAGLEAARVLTIRGHSVLVVDKASKIGGSLHLANTAPMKAELDSVIEYYQRQMEKLNVNIQLETAYSKELVKEYSPEAVIIATGSEPKKPDIEGLEEIDYILYSELLSEEKIPQEEEIVVLGGGMIGIEVADYLSKKHDKKVIIVEENATLGSDLYSLVGSEIVQKTLDNEKITVHVDTQIEKIDNSKIIGTKKNKEFSLPFTSLILANQPKPNSPNEIEIREIVPNTFKIGDCKKRTVRKLLEAVEEGYQIALNIEEAEPQPIVTFDEDDSDLKSVVIRKIRNGTFSIEDIPEYLEVMVQICNSDKKIQKKSRKSNLKFQFNVVYGPSFWIKIDKGKFSSGEGVLEDYDVVIEMNKNIAAGMFTGEVNAAAAYMSKQLKFDGPLRHGMKFQKWTNAVQKELGVDT